jgi:seryl-tRNA synthetase
MRKLFIILGAIIVLGFVTLGINNIATTNNKVYLQSVKIKDVNNQLIELESKDNVLNKALDKATTDKNTTQAQLDQLKTQEQQVEQQKEALQAQLQARVDAQSKLNLAADGLTASAASLPAGGHTDWMAQAGISASDYGYVDYIVTHESGWNATEYNKSGSGAYGLGQALPASKMAAYGSDYMTNPITQLIWANAYAVGRYGSWAAAYDYWVSHHLW